MQKFESMHQALEMMVLFIHRATQFLMRRICDGMVLGDAFIAAVIIKSSRTKFHPIDNREIYFLFSFFSTITSHFLKASNT
jgi:hypothetical protein